MDLLQRKLNKSEWESIELPVSQEEISILKLIIAGFHDVSIKQNKYSSLFSFLKIDVTDAMEDNLYEKYFQDRVNQIFRVDPTFENKFNLTLDRSALIKKADQIRLQKNTSISVEKTDVYEYVLLDILEKLVKYKVKKSDKWIQHYYTLYKLMKNSISNVNRHIVRIIQDVLRNYEDEVDVSYVVHNSVSIIENNEKLLKYGDMNLYAHQKEIFTACKNSCPKLVLYIAPTGTGKTMTPLGLSEKQRVIFVCAARHVGLALARSAISVDKKVAFAFGCSSSADIRLHYFAAKEYTKHRKSGGIFKVDNSVGDKVEIMICDIKSYLVAMYYMLAFNSKDDIITYWDEPTITLDYDNHDFHEIIKKNWDENLIPNMVLSSATLPKLHELPETISSFKAKFEDAEVYNIVSHDCKKSIPLLNKDGYVVLPHTLPGAHDYEKLLEYVNHCENYLTLMRYFDLNETVKLIKFVNQSNLTKRGFSVDRYFASLDDVNMINIKLYYIAVLKNIISGTWGTVYMNYISNREKKIKPNMSVDPKGNKIKKSVSIGPGIVSQVGSSLGGSGLTRLASQQIVPPVTEDTSGGCAIYVTTKDSYTLTDGPTIFLANDIEKIAKFCIQQANIPAKVMQDIMEKIEYNNGINEKIQVLEKTLEDLTAVADEDAKKFESDKHGSGGKKQDHKMMRQLRDDNPGNSSVKRVMEQIGALRSMVKTATLNDTFVPNKQAHLQKWAEDIETKTAFTCDIEESTIARLMLLHNVSDSWKVLLLMGIGVFTNHESIEYTEIMKDLADRQKLYMIIASSDYIYGTNYQFCHGYLSKDLDLTQEKIIQAMGRIGRNKMQQDYTVRFRDNEQIVKLFTADAEKPEIVNMNRLFGGETL